jgi:hypothetical protein
LGRSKSHSAGENRGSSKPAFILILNQIRRPSKPAFILCIKYTLRRSLYLSKTEPKTAKSVADEQIEFKGKLDNIAELNPEEIRFLNQTIVQIWDMKSKAKDLNQ